VSVMPDAVAVMAGADLPMVAGPAEVADLLVLVAHRACPDKRRFGVRYWDALAERVRAATYMGLTLRAWWRRLVADMGIVSPWPVDQALTARLLDASDDIAVLRVLREETAVVVLRVRLASNAAKNTAAQHDDVLDLDDMEDPQ
jgi:hypothetical protein